MDDHTKTCVSNALNFIRTRQDLIDFVIDENNSLENTGFLWSNDTRVNEIGNALINDNHSGSSFACTLRICQEILRKEKHGNEKTNDPFPIANSDIDDCNKRAINVMDSEGPTEAIKHMFTRDDGTTRTYAEMRALYG